jgi:membrane-anchored protein YejM (alkaline phosphatase superfamily)
MKNVGLLSKDVITKTRVLEAMEDQGYQLTIINSSVFDSSGFDVLMVDLDDPTAMLVLKNHAYKSIAFASANDEDKLKAAKLAGCDRVYKHGEFFKKILPKFKI